jgi:hypothetical protein
LSPFHERPWPTLLSFSPSCSSLSSRVPGTVFLPGIEFADDSLKSIMMLALEIVRLIEFPMAMDSLRFLGREPWLSLGFLN